MVKRIKKEEELWGRLKRRFGSKKWMTLFGGHPVPIILSGGVNGFSIACPAITPTLGAELLANPGLEGTYDDESGGGGGTVNVAPNWNNNACETDGTDTLDKELTVVHGGSASQKIIVNAPGEGITTSPTAVFSSGTWYQISGWAYRAAGTGLIRFSDTGVAIFCPLLGSGGAAWAQTIGTGRATGNTYFRISSYDANGFNGYVDDASAKAITLSTTMTFLGTLSGRNGTYTCTPTAEACTQAGMIVAYLNTTNFVLADVDRNSFTGTATAKLLKYIGGTWTSVISADVTYGAAKELKVVISGTNYSLYYDSVQVGTTQTISDTLGADVYGFNTYAGNTVGTVVATP